MKMCEIILYPADGWDKAGIENVIANRASVKEYSYILHNKDIDENGKPKKPHYHCFLSFGTTNCRIEHIAGWFDTSPNMVQHIKAKRNGKYYALKYFLHIGFEDKHLYTADEITANFDVAAFLETERKKMQDNSNLHSILADCANGNINRLNYHEHISVEMFAKHKPKIERAWELFEHKRKRENGNRRTTTTIYVYGESGVGKTLNCKLFAQGAGLTAYTTTPGKNPFDEYCGEQAIILDEIRPSEPFSHHELLKLLDPHNSSMAPARYANKFLQNSHYFLTSIFSPEEFWQGFGLSQRDTAGQFYRRLAEVWHIDKAKIHICKFIEDEFKPVFVIENPAALFLAKQKRTVAELATPDVFQKILTNIQQDKLFDLSADNKEAV